MRKAPRPYPFFSPTLAQLDTLRFRVHAHTTLAPKSFEVTVNVSVLLPPAADHTAARSRASVALFRLLATAWALEEAGRVIGARGSAEVIFRATARISPAVPLVLLQRLADAISGEQLRLTNLALAPASEPHQVVAAAQSLREETLGVIERQAASLSVQSGRRWAIREVEYGADVGRSTPPAPMSQATAERVVLVTEVVLKAESLTVH